MPDTLQEGRGGLRRMFAAVALALVVAPLLASAPLFDPDEGLHAAIAQEMVQRGDYVTPTFLGAPFLDKPILFFWTEAGSLRLFGDREAAVRLPPLLFGLLGMLSVAALAQALFGERTGRIAGIAYGTMILPLGVSQVAVHDIGLIPFMCAACWCLYAASEATLVGRKVLLLAVIAGIALGLSILTKGLVGCVFACIFAAALAIRRPRAFAPLAVALIVGGLAALLVAAPWYVAMEHAHPGYLHYYFVERHLQGYLTATQRHAGRPWWYYVPIVFGGALPWAGYLVLAARAARRDRLCLLVWGWFVVGLAFLSIGESKLVTYVLPLFPAIAILVAVSITTRAGAGFAAAFGLHSLAAIGLPAAGLLAIKWKYGADHPGLWPLVAATSVATAYALWRAWTGRRDERFMTWASAAAIASLAGTMIVMPRAADWMTSRDLAAALNARRALPSRVSVVDERIGSLVFYLSPALRAAATPERLVDVSFSDAVLGARVGPDDAIVAVRANQLDRFNRMFPRPPVPDERAGTFAIFRAVTLRETLQPRTHESRD